jgi:subtilisin family serine protease
LVQNLKDTIATEQVGYIQNEFSQKNINVQTVPGRGGAYTFATDHILVKEDKVPVVQAFLGKVVTAQAAEEVIPGVMMVRFGPLLTGQPAPTVLDVIERINQGVGEGIAGTDGVMTVTNDPPEGGPCPATEPEEAYFDIEPFPGVRMENDGTDGTGARIFIADTGLLDKPEWQSHSWLTGKEPGEEVRGCPDPLDPKSGGLIKPYAAHGTFVAGVARCMAPKAEIFVSNVFKTAGSALESDLVKVLAKALDDGFDIFNLSVTTPSRGELKMIGFEGWLKLLEQHPGVVCVVSAGNDHTDKKFYPAAYENPQIVSVGALAADWRSRASFSNYGDWVKVYAPGRDLVNAYASGIYECKDAPYTGQIRRFYGMAKWSGTSFSTPLVAGLIAARKSRTGTTALKAAHSLLADAGKQAIPGIGSVLFPYKNAFKL